MLDVATRNWGVWSTRLCGAVELGSTGESELGVIPLRSVADVVGIGQIG